EWHDRDRTERRRRHAHRRSPQHRARRLPDRPRIVPFELVDAELAECGGVQQRLRKLPVRGVVHLLPDAALFEDCGYREVWRKLTGALVGLPLVEVTATALWHARCRL